MTQAGSDVIVVGAGFAGLYLLHLLRGRGKRVQVLEAGDGVGGTWYWNRYPGARCDVESAQYSFQFDPELEQEWDWSERYAAQPEILAYAEHVAERLDLKRDIRFNTRVAEGAWDDAAGLWRLRAEDGAEFAAPVCVMATGCLSAPNTPDIPGLEDFRGPVYHTGTWPKQKVDFHGRRVGVIGAGSSAIQSIPQIAREAAELVVFQRTPNYAVPAHNRPLTEADRAACKADYPDMRRRQKRSPNNIDRRAPAGAFRKMTPEQREAELWRRWEEGGLPFMAVFEDALLDDGANEAIADFVRDRIREIVKDPETAGLLCPDNVIGCKRLCVEIDYFETFNRDNVRLVDVKARPIDRITPDGLEIEGERFAFDSLVLATGFDAMTGALTRIDIRGREGVSLREAWAEGPKSYLGLAVAGFPNLFTVTGPGSPSVLTNMIPSIEQHVEWITDCLDAMEARGARRIEATEAAQEDWVKHNADLVEGALKADCSSWYVGANIPGKPRVFMPYLGGFPAYAEKCAEVARKDYEGFAFG
ncbi:MAG: flavin-containing monooxygenase [Pseudomonadota bacterium]